MRDWRYFTFQRLNVGLYNERGAPPSAVSLKCSRCSGVSQKLMRTELSLSGMRSAALLLAQSLCPLILNHKTVRRLYRHKPVYGPAWLLRLGCGERGHCHLLTIPGLYSEEAITLLRILDLTAQVFSALWMYNAGVLFISGS